jgi:hypothetical protein
MPDDISMIPRKMTATRIANRLSFAADQLAGARDPAAFLDAMASQRRLWRHMQRASALMGYKIPDRVMDFSFEIATRRDGGWNDHEVEALISIERTVSQELARATRLPAE